MIALNTEPAQRLRALARQSWDAIVVGAGPAGSVAARQLARLGRSVLLLDKADFPRYKVCGCCLNATAVALLKQIGLGQLLSDLHAQPIDQLTLAAGGHMARLALAAGGVAVSREAFDSALVEQATTSGAEFCGGVSARLIRETADVRIVELSRNGDMVEAAAKVVVAADGLRGSLLEHDPHFHRAAAVDSLIGIGTTLANPPAVYREGTIYMAVASGGYVGQVLLEDGRLDVAAALDRRSLAVASGPAQAARRIVEQAGLPWPDELSLIKWHGTPPLTRRLTHVAGRRLFVIGDAGAYVEPFTGEGMAWAILSACAVAPLASAAVDGDSLHWAPRWEALHRRLLGRRMFVCRGISRMLRSPGLTRTAIAAISKAPWLAAPLIRYLTSPRLSRVLNLRKSA